MKSRYIIIPFVLGLFVGMFYGTSIKNVVYGKFLEFWKNYIGTSGMIISEDYINIIKNNNTYSICLSLQKYNIDFCKVVEEGGSINYTNNEYNVSIVAVKNAIKINIEKVIKII